MHILRADSSFAPHVLSDDTCAAEEFTRALAFDIFQTVHTVAQVLDGMLDPSEYEGDNPPVLDVQT